MTTNQLDARPLPQPLSRERERVADRPGEGKQCAINENINKATCQTIFPASGKWFSAAPVNHFVGANKKAMR